MSKQEELREMRERFKAILQGYGLLEMAVALGFGHVEEKELPLWVKSNYGNATGKSVYTGYRFFQECV